jgi:hypothetical protein
MRVPAVKFDAEQEKSRDVIFDVLLKERPLNIIESTVVPLP